MTPYWLLHYSLYRYTDSIGCNWCRRPDWKVPGWEQTATALTNSHTQYFIKNSAAYYMYNTYCQCGTSLGKVWDSVMQYWQLAVRGVHERRGRKQILHCEFVWWPLQGYCWYRSPDNRQYLWVCVCHNTRTHSNRAWYQVPHKMPQCTCIVILTQTSRIWQTTLHTQSLRSAHLYLGAQPDLVLLWDGVGDHNLLNVCNF